MIFLLVTTATQLSSAMISSYGSSGASMNRILSYLVFAYRGAIGALAAGRRLGSDNRGLRMEDSLLPAVLCFHHLSSILHPRCRLAKRGLGSVRVSRAGDGVLPSRAAGSAAAAAASPAVVSWNAASD